MSRIGTIKKTIDKTSLCETRALPKTILYQNEDFFHYIAKKRTFNFCSIKKKAYLCSKLKRAFMVDKKDSRCSFTSGKCGRKNNDNGQQRQQQVLAYMITC